jgi:hypothetical protein
VSEAAPELVLVKPRLIFAFVSALACRVMSFSRITAPPYRRLVRLQLVQTLPLLGGDQDYRAVAGPHQFRVESLELVADLLLGLAGDRAPQAATVRAEADRDRADIPVLVCREVDGIFAMPAAPA